MFISVIYSGFVKRYSEYCTMYEMLFGFGKSVGLGNFAARKADQGTTSSILQVVNVRQG